ncbi:hypothetical protein KDW_48060 [Dictyobacter vulcani]|uniref:Uncharacterized protein n=1 Tax=Dictyobacter vulcani TaxID=2607529 RepID=A0A5J4KMQ1_9CHLR|nr:hypothetical protein [Dictyobacter vulcani]GER90644.1 hypothetical protein KDW_48060 [Dictyobacter vulcani]
MDSNKQIHYLDRDMAIKANQLAGESGAIRDMNGLESAVVAPRNAALYQGTI